VVPDKRAKRVQNRRYGPILLVALCILAPVLAACGQGGAGHPGVSLLPDSAAGGRGWDWTARCQFGPYAHKACKTSGPVLGVAQLNGDEWNLGGGATTAGSLGMSVSSPGALAVQGDFPSTPPCTQSTCLAPSAYTWVRGYPNVLYGINLCHKATSPPESKTLPLPMQVRAIPSDLIGTTTYSSHTGQVTYDIAYDLWLNPSATKAPCRTDGTLEVMVWTDYDLKALLPGSMEVGTASIPFSTGGVVRPDKQAWSIYASNVFTNGQTAPWGGAIWVVLNAADTIGKGTVSVDLSSVLSAVGALLQHNYGWSEFRKRYWLDSIPFGMEFGPQDGAVTGTGTSYFSLKLSAYCLSVRTTLSQAACGSLQQG
jgi:hypothetical protein